ncbi:hypothetical protein DEA8626_00351 [Defluviimonas aquaemixtae]|uniref:Uncharacterized protein n=1 Tax=Albidovulum aquaemixtae TaxID=1542388 RepID=A0A2R8B2M9_9RHOB|nr:hypothetical protein DEA8626_00351 [Defluviimonas aquaemixtae]
MTDPFKHMDLRRRISLAIWVINAILVLALAAFALR